MLQRVWQSPQLLRKWNLQVEKLKEPAQGASQHKAPVERRLSLHSLLHRLSQVHVLVSTINLLWLAALALCVLLCIVNLM